MSCPVDHFISVLYSVGQRSCPASDAAVFPRPVGQESQDYQPEELNKRAIAITQRVKQKLTGQHSLHSAG